MRPTLETNSIKCSRKRKRTSGSRNNENLGNSIVPREPLHKIQRVDPKPDCLANTAPKPVVVESIAVPNEPDSNDSCNELFVGDWEYYRNRRKLKPLRASLYRWLGVDSSRLVQEPGPFLMPEQIDEAGYELQRTARAFPHEFSTSRALLEKWVDFKVGGAHAKTLVSKVVTPPARADPGVSSAFGISASHQPLFGVDAPPRADPTLSAAMGEPLPTTPLPPASAPQASVPSYLASVLADLPSLFAPSDVAFSTPSVPLPLTSATPTTMPAVEPLLPTRSETLAPPPDLHTPSAQEPIAMSMFNACDSWIIYCKESLKLSADDILKSMRIPNTHSAAIEHRYRFLLAHNKRVWSFTYGRFTPYRPSGVLYDYLPDQKHSFDDQLTFKYGKINALKSQEFRKELGGVPNVKKARKRYHYLLLQNKKKWREIHGCKKYKPTEVLL